MGEETEDMIAKKIENAREILSSKASTSGADPRKNSCAQCGSTEVKVQGKTTLLKCSRCKITCYCSPECKNNSPPLTLPPLLALLRFDDYCCFFFLLSSVFCLLSSCCYQARKYIGQLGTETSVKHWSTVVQCKRKRKERK